MPQEKPLKSTQSFLRVAEIKQDVMIMDDTTHCAVIAVSSTNFELKSQEEQNALIYGYQTFLNSLDFEIQILMQSRKMDISVYLEKLRTVMEQQTNELLRVQTGEYIEFIEKLVEGASIMNKSFYVIVPYRPALIEGPKKEKGGILGLFKKKSNKEEIAEKVKDFQDNKLKLDRRVNVVMGGLSSLGLKSIQLRTEEIIELLYNSYNFETGPAFDASKLGEIKLKERES